MDSSLVNDGGSEGFKNRFTGEEASETMNSRFQTTSSDLRLLCSIGRFFLYRVQQRYQQLFHQSLKQRSFHRLGIFVAEH